jgi:protein TonB
MERRLFDDLVVSRRHDAPRSRSGMPVSFAIHAAGLAALLTLGALVPDELPVAPVMLPRLETVVVAAPTPPMGARSPRAPAARTAPPRAPDSQSTVTIPDEAPIAPDPETSGDPRAEDFDVDPCPDCLPGDGRPGVPGGHPAGEIGGAAGAAPARVRVGGQLDAPRKLRHVDPVYPEIARRAGLSATVVIECVIGLDGRIASARVLRGHPLLEGAALDAVRQWAYRPPLLNGRPVEAVMTVTVRFEAVR